MTRTARARLIVFGANVTATSTAGRVRRSPRETPERVTVSD
ncbi:hypothetical protein OG417_37465 [Actinoallomurus sp. NBC_01490]|nr:hypothetical protein [Actinoallomurus sp. NBC_01490]